MNTIIEPIFIICTGRSGSTLLRYILDAHDMIDAPQELHLGPLIKEMTRVMSLLHEESVEKDIDLDAVVIREVRSQIDSMMRTTLKKPIWCDKSVSSIDHLDEIMHIFPKAKYIFLYRDCLDFVHSALEATKYGFNGFYFEDFILQNPENIVDGLVNFWCLQSEKRLKLENQNKHSIFPIKYEDIVKSPKQTLETLFRFLNLDFNENTLESLFLKYRLGRGDLKVQSSGSIQDMTGKGRDVPLKHIKSETFERMNLVLKQIGYPGIELDYNFTIKGDPNIDQYGEHTNDELYKYFSVRLQENIIPPEIMLHKLSLNIPGLVDDHWLIDFKNKQVSRNTGMADQATLDLKIRIDTLLRIVDKKLNISWAYRDGLVQTSGSYKQLNEIGKFLFG